MFMTRCLYLDSSPDGIRYLKGPQNSSIPSSLFSGIEKQMCSVIATELKSQGASVKHKFLRPHLGKLVQSK